MPPGEAAAQLTISTKSVEKIERWLRALPRPVWLAVEACPFVEWFIDRYRDCVDADRHRRRHGTGQPPRQATEERSATTPSTSPSGWRAASVPWASSPIRQLMQLRKLGRHWRQLSRLLGPQQARHEVDAQRGQPARPEVRRRRRPTLAVGPRRTCSSPSNGRPSPTYFDVVLLTERHRERLRREMLFAARSEALRPNATAPADACRASATSGV